MESVGESFHVFFDREGCFYTVEKFADCISCFVGERLLATTEHDFYLYLVSAREEFFCLCSFEVEIVRVGAQTEADTFGLDFLLLALGFLFLFSLGVEVLAVVENLADRRGCLWGDFDEVELLLLGAGNCLFGRHILIDGSVCIDDKHKWHTNVLIDTCFRCFDNFRSGPSVTTSTHSFCVKK